jgi:ABC-type uncharacterized transport system substrate-binding protein
LYKYSIRFAKEVYMRFLVIFALILLTASASVAAPKKKLYRLGVPAKYSTPVYQAMLDELEKYGYVIGENLQLVHIDLRAAKDPANHARLRKQLIYDTDMMFISCDKLLQYYDLDVLKPTLFFGPKGMNYTPPEKLKPYLTGVWRGSVEDVFLQVDRMIPNENISKIGIPYFIGSNLEDIVSYFEQAAEKVGLEIVSYGYRDKADVEKMMRFFKQQVKAVFVVPPAINEEVFPELVYWQKKLKLPLLSQQRKHVENGILAGTTLDMQVLAPKLAEYIDKILNGRKPSKLPIYTSNLKHVINLEVASKLDIKIPREVIRQSEIIGIAQTSAGNNQVANTQILSGHYRIGTTDSIIDTVKDQTLAALAERGYALGKNLELVTVQLNRMITAEGRKDLEQQLNTTDALLITDNAAYDIIKLGLKKPVVLLGISDINDIPAESSKYFTGVWRASCRKVLDMAKQMFPDVTTIGMAYRENTRMQQIIHHHKSVAEDEDIDLIIKPFKSSEDIPELMRQLKNEAEVILLFPAGVNTEDVKEFVKMQNSLDLPVLSQLRQHIELGLIGGPTVDLEHVIPRLAEYLDKILQGRSPEQLKTYQYIPQYVINLNTAKQLEVKIPRRVLRQSDIINR